MEQAPKVPEAVKLYIINKLTPIIKETGTNIINNVPSLLPDFLVILAMASYLQGWKDGDESLGTTDKELGAFAQEIMSFLSNYRKWERKQKAATQKNGNSPGHGDNRIKYLGPEG